MITAAPLTRASRPRGITLTEILIAILIMGVGLVSLATLFPIGLLRLRDATRYSRSSFLAQSAAADLTSRSLLSVSSFATTGYYSTATAGYYSPFVQDTPVYGSDWATGQPGMAGPGIYSGPGGLGLAFVLPATWAGNAFNVPVTTYPALNGPGLPFAYDPLWRYQTNIFPGNTYEARFGEGLHFIRQDPSGTTASNASACGLQRITNFNPNLNVALANLAPSICVSPEDVVWQEPTNQQYPMGVPIAAANTPPTVGSAPSPVIPDLSISVDQYGNRTYQPMNDFHYSWLFTGYLTNSSNEACFDGNVVIMENRPFGVSQVTAGDGTANVYVPDGETVVEAFFGYSANIQFDTINGTTLTTGYAAGADRTVLLRWFTNQPDPVVKAGDWIADVTYERSLTTTQNRWWQGNFFPTGYANLFNNHEWDNLPAQRCYWYQVQKALPATPDPYLTDHRSMVVYVNQSLIARTAFTAAGVPAGLNAALIMPSVVNVIPTTVFTR